MSDWAARRHAAFRAAIDAMPQRIREAAEFDRARTTAPNRVVPDVRTECCDAPVVVDPARPGFLEMVLALVCARCGAEAGSPGLEDLDGRFRAPSFTWAQSTASPTPLPAGPWLRLRRIT